MEEKKSKFNVFVGLIVVIFILLTMNIYMIHKCDSLKKANASEVEYQPAVVDLKEKGFYPGRVYGDYSDGVFDFSAYLNDIGATEVKRYIYDNNEGRNEELRFKLGNFDYKLKTTIFKTDSYTFGLYTSLEADNGKVRYAVPTTNSGSYIADSKSPIMVDWLIFDVFHNATDSNSQLRQELRNGMDETDCPFYGLGVAHYESWPDGIVIWHDDAGSFTVDGGLDLHY